MLSANLQIKQLADAVPNPTNDLASTTQHTGIHQLPNELIQCILDNLRPKAVYRLLATCKRLHILSDSISLTARPEYKQSLYKKVPDAVLARMQLIPSADYTETFIWDEAFKRNADVVDVVVVVVVVRLVHQGFN